MTEFTIRKSICTEGQWQFLHAQEKGVLLSGGFGSGKTTGLALKILQLKATNGDTPGLILSQTWRSMWSITYRRLMQTLKFSIPKESLPRLHDKQMECYLNFGDGAPVFLRSAESVQGYDGIDVGWVCGDELRHWSKQSYDVALGRMRVKCPLPQAAFSSTPSMGWMAEEFNSNKDNRRLITAPTKENLKNLSPDFIDNLRLSYSPRMARAVIDGEFTVLEGCVYEEFEAKYPWILNYEPANFKNRKTFLAVDPGYRRSAWLWVHEETPTNYIVFDQMIADNMSDLACVEKVNARGWPIDEIWCDPASENAQSAINMNTIKMLQMIKTRTRAPIRYITGPFRSISFGVERVRALLNLVNGIPRIRFASRLLDIEKGKERGIIKDLQSYRYPEVKDGRAVTDIPLKDGVTDHFCDCLRYWSVGAWLTTPLRETNYELSQLKAQGFRTAV